MKRSIILVFIAFISLTIITCKNKKSHNINISQTSNFDRHLNRYKVETTLEINNRFGISQQVSIWEGETTYKADVTDLLKTQRAKADSVCKKF